MSDRNEDADETAEHEGVETDDEYGIERTVTREDAVATLRRLADGVANGSIELGDGAVTATVPERFELEIEYEQTDEDADLEAQLEWPIVGGEAVPAEERSEPSERHGEADDIGAGDPGEEVVEEPASSATADGSIDDVVGAGDAVSDARFELYRDRADEWRWRLVHDNGNIIADSGEGYDRRNTARNGLESVMRNAPGAAVVVRDD